ncbi:uncharacterized protein K452DRAFT_320940 [Aplosporella prunicola CBS 121167]|uniref:Nucleoporin Nup186/Nup192/Nup205 n=1 Tax=Aplosporella prunicola CBS 121167 TaxID=1176127 RepID=A0A6A6B6C9_9PEZI|nr:uncharacterized protein K452DRAFT_320940 [Aplosporella prunicola CBS 121167]KAF2138835.1 hypothetical protein K452DRAFT_320940 [Aplosporella prunicola CBS 121167]
MADTDSLEALQGLHRDLLALSASRLVVLERLEAELEARIEEFKKLLDKPRKNDKSRDAIKAETLKVDDLEYQLNDDFRQETIKVADALDLDEIEAAKLCIVAQEDILELDRSLFTASVIRFHKRRQFLLECLRLVLKQSHDPEANEQLATHFGSYALKVLGIGADHRLENGYAYWQKCLASMGDIERWLQQLADSALAGSVVGKAHTSEDMEILDFQRVSLTRQHESLAAICTSLIKAGYSSIDNFRGLLGTLKSLDKHDVVLIHYVPMVTSSINQLVSSERSSSLEDARSLHQTVVAGKEGEAWKLRNFHAAVMTWWLAEYSGRYIDPQPQEGVDLEAEAERRSQLFLDALKDGALHFILSTSQDVKPNRWYDPAKAHLLSFVLQDAPQLPADSVPLSDHFQSLYMEQMQGYVDAFITNMPDTLRKLKVEEDDRRRMMHARFQRGPVEQELHLERFLLIISYAFAESPDAAQSFWQDTDGNLYGFLQWAAKRQTTPRVAAFCEMLRSLSEGEECAAAAHRFLQEESVIASGKLRRTSSLSYAHILNELQFYANSIRDRPSPAASGFQPAPQNPNEQIVEPETAMMLECHMRLLAHLCRESSEARLWTLSHATFNVPDILLQLSTITMESRLRACAFSCLSSLLVGKNIQIGDGMWSALDQWMIGGTHISAGVPRPPSFGQQERLVFETIASDYDEATAFMGLLTALVSPYSEDSGLHDALPFPETLGSSYRMPGIEKFIDFAMERIFDQLCKKVEDPLQLRVLRWHCLNFIATCLATFNEDLVVFANQSSIAVDSAIHSSSLAAYVRLHPFARVMEWLFNDNVLSSLFAAAQQDVEEVNDSTPDSPLLMSLVKAIEVLDLVMKLQRTYLDIVRRVIKEQSTVHRRVVANTALASFEDAVLNNLSTVVYLGLYCGTGHQDLTLASLQLLEKLSSSRKLVVSPTAGFGQRSDRSKIIGILEKDNDAERIAKSLSAEMQLDSREFEAGPISPGYAIKMSILDFLNSCLSALPNRPTIAHLLLGFSCGTSTIDVPDDGLFAAGNSLFHAILKLAVEYPEMVDGSFTPWSSIVKQKCIDILMKLWRSPLSSAYVMAELRTAELFSTQALRQHLVEPATLFGGKDIADPDFIFADSAIALEKFFCQRTAFYEYTARELRLAHQGGMPTLRARMQSTLLGVTLTSDGAQIQNPSVFDLFDFMELEVMDDFALPPLIMLGSLDFNICRTEGEAPHLQYNMQSVQELITLRANELRRDGKLPTPVEETQLQTETQIVLGYLLGVNQRQNVAIARADVLKAWVQLMMVVLEACEFDPTTKTSFILQALQVILPKLEKAYTEDVTTAVNLADLARTLLTYVDFKSMPLEGSRAGDLANDRLTQLFRVALSGIFCLVSNAALREICYQICYRYLRGTVKKEPAKKSPNGTPLSGSFSGSLNGSLAVSTMALAKPSPTSSPKNTHTLRIVKSAGTRLMDVVCDDSYAGQGTCRISALLFLDALVALGTREDSRYVIDSFVRLNFIDVLVDSIKLIPTELRNASAADVPLLLSFIDANLSLLLRISQTKLGAACVLNAGLFQSVRDSQIFAADPDFGLEMENANALKKFFELMLSVLRVINSVVVTRGPQNEQTRQQARYFIDENRASIVSVFKRHARVGGRSEVAGSDLDELVDNLMILISATDFLEYEEEATKQKPSLLSFS